MNALSALEAVQSVTDPHSFTPWGGEFATFAPLSPAYSTELKSACQEAGTEESVLIGYARIGGFPVGVLAWEFAFLGGSVGVGTAARVVAAVRRATDQGLPLVAMPRSGGTRMQEGAPAFVQMVAIAAALSEHRAAGLPYLVHLCGPTTGGVLATLGSAGDVTSAEPGAMVGFLGPRAFTAITGQVFPDGIQTAENLLSRGIIDAVVSWERLPELWATILGLWATRPLASPVPDAEPGQRARAPIPGAPDSVAQLWKYVEVSRRPDRVDSEQFLTEHLADMVVLPGTGQGDVAQGAVVALGRLSGIPVVVAATTDRRTGEPLTVGGLRTVGRGIALAQLWGLPMVTIVDTLGAQLSAEGEQAGIAGEISRLMLDLVAARIPTVALLLGAGTGGAALAMLATDRIVAGSHTWVAPLAPEGAAAIRHGGTHDPAQIAWDQRIGAHALAELGFIDRVVRESDPGWVSMAADEVGACLREVIAGVDPRRRCERFDAWAT
ncbi:MAG TPA: carboxyl transferase domain-containing protein [Motilibacterales bacterium]|nr:carboxyl transferase domain-containing protein [Motilibacterales bacterium]